MQRVFFTKVTSSDDRLLMIDDNCVGRARCPVRRSLAGLNAIVDLCGDCDLFTSSTPRVPIRFVRLPVQNVVAFTRPSVAWLCGRSLGLPVVRYHVAKSDIKLTKGSVSHLFFVDYKKVVAFISTLRTVDDVVVVV